MILLMYILLDDSRDREVSRQMREGDKTDLFILWMVACLLVIGVGAMTLAKLFS